MPGYRYSSAHLCAVLLWLHISSNQQTIVSSGKRMNRRTRKQNGDYDGPSK